MDRLRADAIASIERTIESSEALRAHLEVGEETGREMIAKLETGIPVSTAVDAVGLTASALRTNLSQHLDDFEHRRHEMRILFIGAALDEGLSIGEIARKLGVSRQLLSRFAKEARGDEFTEETGPE